MPCGGKLAATTTGTFNRHPRVSFRPFVSGWGFGLGASRTQLIVTTTGTFRTHPRVSFTPLFWGWGVGLGAREDSCDSYSDGIRRDVHLGGEECCLHKLKVYISKYRLIEPLIHQNIEAFDLSKYRLIERSIYRDIDSSNLCYVKISTCHTFAVSKCRLVELLIT